MKEITKTDTTVKEVRQILVGNEQPKRQAPALAMSDLKALQDKSRQMLRPQHYGGYVGL